MAGGWSGRDEGAEEERCESSMERHAGKRRVGDKLWRELLPEDADGL